jgi:hypothetical protein
MANETGGPFITAALLCDRVLQESDGTISIIRILDRYTLTNIGPQAPAQMPPLPLAMTLFLSFKSGIARGTFRVKVTITTPSNIEDSLGQMSMLCEGEDRGNNIITSLRLNFTESGLYWINVYLEEQLVTRIPLRLIYSQVTR